jgi:hypothetical protein
MIRAFDTVRQQVSPDTPCSIGSIAGKKACRHLQDDGFVASGSDAGGAVQPGMTHFAVGPLTFEMTTPEFAIFQVVLIKRARAWRWCVCTIDGSVVMRGSESSRPAAQYRANRALFLLLLTSHYRLKRRSASLSLDQRVFGQPRSVG